MREVRVPAPELPRVGPGNAELKQKFQEKLEIERDESLSEKALEEFKSRAKTMLQSYKTESEEWEQANADGGTSGGWTNEQIYHKTY